MPKNSLQSPTAQTGRIHRRATGPADPCLRGVSAGDGCAQASGSPGKSTLGSLQWKAERVLKHPMALEHVVTIYRIKYQKFQVGQRADKRHWRYSFTFIDLKTKPRGRDADPQHKETPKGKILRVERDNL